jgi:transcriptional regulator with XRE-family HTH domain
MENNYSFGELLKSRRNEKGFSLRYLADKLHITVSSVYYFEEGSIFPTSKILERICTILKINKNQAANLIKKDKAYRKHLLGKRRNFGLTSAKYPILRETLINTYTHLGSKDLIRPYNLVQELKKYPFHPFEKEVLNIIVELFTQEGLIKPGFGIFELLAEGTKNELKNKLKKINFSWSYNTLNDEIIIHHFHTEKDSDIPKENTITLKRTWHKESH